MSKTTKEANPWLESVIRSDHERKSRYEIDLDLLEASYPPEAIEVAWKSVQSEPQPQRRLEKLGRLLPQMVVGYGIGYLLLTILYATYVFIQGHRVVEGSTAGLFYLPLQLKLFGIGCLSLPLVVGGLVAWRKPLSSKAKRRLFTSMVTVLIGMVPLLGTSVVNYYEYVGSTEIGGRVFQVAIYANRFDTNHHINIYECDGSGFWCHQVFSASPQNPLGNSFHLNMDTTTNILTIRQSLRPVPETFKGDPQLISILKFRPDESWQVVTD